MARAILAVVCLAWLTPSLLAQDWPRWRGPGANGVGVVSRAPERWSPHTGIVWRAEIDGHGISSPVVAGNRVYLTTAITAEQRPASRLALDCLIGCLSLLGIPALVRYRYQLAKAPAVDGRDDRTRDAILTLDFVLFVLLAATLFVFGTCMAIGPKAVDAALTSVRDAGVVLARLLGREQTNLSFLDWNEGNRHNTWIISSAVALLAFALIPLLSPIRSVVRVVGGLALLIGIAVGIALVPWAVPYGSRFPRGALVVLYAPVVAVAVWQLFQFAIWRNRVTGDPAGATRRPRLAAGLPAVLSLAVFVSPNYVYQREMVTRRVVCLDATSGAEVWHTDVFSTPPESRSSLNSDATPTPTVAGDVIVAAFGPGIAAVDLDGELLWSKVFPDWIENSVYGAGSSPVTDGEAVFVTVDGEYGARRQSRVVAYALRTGDELWSRVSKFAHDGYATPVVYDDGYRKLLLTVTSKTLVAYVAASGAVAWRLKIPVHQPIPSLIVEDGRMFVTGGVGNEGHTAAYRLHHDGTPRVLWASPQRADVSSPVLYKGRLYTISSTGVMVCYDGLSGRILWKRRIGSGLGAFYASLAAADGKVYAVRSNGTTYVIAAEDEFRLITQSSLPEETFASPALSGNCLVLRTVSAVYCIGDVRPARRST